MKHDTLDEFQAATVKYGSLQVFHLLFLLTVTDGTMNSAKLHVQKDHCNKVFSASLDHMAS